ncbi:MAG TPA: hypothetical protein VKM72_17790 [Thermoanaerobaculia bacterium]|nr:hypothetical protein [Thermoanaerobaculia bacterium]
MDEDWLDIWQSEGEDEDREWYTGAAIALERSYAEDEPEYPLELIKEWNPDYRQF